jgi:hypothetical protein
MNAVLNRIRNNEAMPKDYYWDNESEKKDNYLVVRLLYILMVKTLIFQCILRVDKSNELEFRLARACSLLLYRIVRLASRDQKESKLVPVFKSFHLGI